MSLKSLIRQAKREGGGQAAGAGRDAELGGDGAAAGPPGKPPGGNLPSLPLPPAMPPVDWRCSIDGGALGGDVLLAEEWLPMAAEAQLISHLRASASDFVQLRTKRTARYGGDPGPPFVAEPMPAWISQLCTAVSAAVGAGLPCPNHVLVNHYRAGQGIMPHTDGPAYDPRAAILSLGSAAVFDFWRGHAHAAAGGRPALSLLLPPRSLLVFSGAAYSAHLHGIAERCDDELAHVANWTPKLSARLGIGAPSAGSAGIEGGDGGAVQSPAWVSRQLEFTEAGPAVGGRPADDAVSCRLRREERYSLTIRHVPVAPAVPLPNG